MDNKQFLEEFKKITEKMYEIAVAKNSDYAGSTVESDPFHNFKTVESLGVCQTEQGFLTRMTDKFCRITNFVRSGELKVKDESVEDTLLDLANYAIIMRLYLKSKKNPTNAMN